MKHGFTNQRCPKCGGNTYIDVGYYREGALFNRYEQECCLQCGYIIYDPGGSPESAKVTAFAGRAVSVEKEPSLV